MTDDLPAVGTCATCGVPLGDHCLRVTLYVVKRLRRARAQNQLLNARLTELEGVREHRDRLLDEVRQLNAVVRRRRAGAEPQEAA